jgi:3-oxoadipate enol-lactonase
VRLLLLHAFPFDERMWGPQLSALAEHDVLVPHLYTLGTTMDDWAQALSSTPELQGEDVAVVGASMGGYCAQRLLAYTEVRALVLVGSRAQPDTPERKQARDETIRLLHEDGVPALWELQRPALFPKEADEAVVARARELALEQDPEELASGVAAMRDRPDSTELIRATDANVLIARGEHDPFLSADEAGALAASGPHGSSHTFAGAGHLPSLEQPEEFNRVLTDFLNG